MNLPDERKLSITHRVEPGCLGPKGVEVAEAFCEFAQQRFKTIDSDFVIWNIIPRFDKSLPEMQFHVLGKQLLEDQARQYLTAFEKDLDVVEMHLGDMLTTLIDEFMGH
jgi:hypothetical protein